jgi:hypothetical protein
MRGTGHAADKVGRDPVDPRIHLLAKMMDCRLKAGNDGGETVVAASVSCPKTS